MIHIDEFSSTPKYRQLANSIIEGIQAGKIKQGDVLPSINELSFEHYISRITVEKGYNYLKSLGIVESVRGKGFFISAGSVPANFRIFLLFNKLSVHKKIIYDSSRKNLPNVTQIYIQQYLTEVNYKMERIKNIDNNYFFENYKDIVKSQKASPRSIIRHIALDFAALIFSLINKRQIQTHTIPNTISSLKRKK